MIFVILGSQKFQFNRLLKYIDELIENKIITEEVIVQSGYSDYSLKNAKSFPFLEKNKFEEYISEARVIVTHGGTGSIVSSIKQGKKVIAVPRKSSFGEHVDDHQFEITNLYAELGYCLEAIDFTSLTNALNSISLKEFKKFNSNNKYFIDSLLTILID